MDCKKLFPDLFEEFSTWIVMGSRGKSGTEVAQRILDFIGEIDAAEEDYLAFASKPATFSASLEQFRIDVLGRLVGALRAEGCFGNPIDNAGECHGDIGGCGSCRGRYGAPTKREVEVRCSAPEDARDVWKFALEEDAEAPVCRCMRCRK